MRSAYSQFGSKFDINPIPKISHKRGTLMTVPDHDQVIPSSDSYDPHIIPAETAARKDREGNDFKHVPDAAESEASIDTTGGYTVDQEGLANNYAIEPEMYSETPGDMESSSIDYTIVDIFPSTEAAESVATQMQGLGLDPNKISILGHDYRDKEHVHGSLSWREIARADGLAAVLVGLGITQDEALRYEQEVHAGQFIVLVTGSEENISQANQVFHAIGHKTLAEATL
jgi:hypothetical protein